MTDRQELITFEAGSNSEPVCALISKRKTMSDIFGVSKRALIEVKGNKIFSSGHLLVDSGAPIKSLVVYDPFIVV